MLPDAAIRRISIKELTLFFNSPVAYLFLASFAAVTLFVFFWGETFFARNIADIRPLFEWMPLLLIFLTSALTMRMWSEERHSGTLEYILTQPLPIWRFVLGKFFACFSLLFIAILITLPIPVTVSMISDLDWGPVWSGYLATLLLGAAYLSVGLFVSARSDNQIVSLISATALCGLLYLIGSPMITDILSNQMAEGLRLLGTGSRFADITRGVIDVSDFVYYLSLIAIFLTLNTFSLERERWAKTGNKQHHTKWYVGSGLLVANAIAINLWMGQVDVLRIDTTQGKIYSISDATKNYLAQLQEPLLIRGYFSSKTHPLLSPLVPQLRDLIDEYQVAGKGQVRVEFVDPQSSPEVEQEANQKYGIQPVPFQVSDRYQASVVNSYFNVLIQYGDQHQVLGFRDLIEVKQKGETDLDVLLRNPEYDITRAIKKVMLAYQSGGNLFDTVKGNIDFTAYVSADARLPEKLSEFKQALQKKLEQKQQQSNGRLQVKFVEPEAKNGAVAKQIADDYGFKPMVASLFDNKPFYFYLTLSNGDQIVQLPTAKFSADEFDQALDAGIKRFASGFTRTVALVAPKVDYQAMQMGLSSQQFNQLQKVLSADLSIKNEDLSDGSVDSAADILLLMAPKDLDEKELFAVDQFLMRGGSVVAATSPFSVDLGRNRLSMKQQTSGLEDWLKHNGLKIEPELVLDNQNSAFPVPVTRQVGGLRFQEIRMIDYPYFVDIRGKGLNQKSPITGDLNQLSMAWSSPITVDEKLNANRQVTELLHSSDQSWRSSSTDVMPEIDSRGRSSIHATSELGSELLAVVSQGRFDSYFAGKKSPLIGQTAQPDDKAKADTAEAKKEDQQSSIDSVIEHSADSARIILFASNDFVSDQVVQLSASANGSQYLGGLQLVQNTLDWATEESGLLSIRSRGHFNRTLPPMPEGEQLFWEVSNYVLTIVLLILLAVVQKFRQRRRSYQYIKNLMV